MIHTTNTLLFYYKKFSDPYGKIRRLTKDEELHVISKGLYTDDPEISGLYVANAIYGPSYLSFNTALSYWGLIPEGVYSFTSATTRKLKKKTYSNHLGTFTYRDVPPTAYPYGIKIINNEEYPFMIASKEKALCDKLYELPRIKNQKELKDILFDDMRIDEDIFNTLNRDDIYFLADKYHSTNVVLLEKHLRRIHNE